MTSRAHLVVAVLACALGACFHGKIDGSFRASDGPGAPWQLTPDRCISGQHSGYLGADMYRKAEGDDTELVVVKDGDGFRVLVRVPNRGKMVVLAPADCSVFEAEIGLNGVEVNDVAGVRGSVRLDCSRPEIGHVVGRAVFSCF